MFKRFLLTLPLLVITLSCAASEDSAATYVAGEHYDLIAPPLRVDNPDKINVSEFFWYGCSHCYSFEPVIAQWKKGIADDVEFVAIPAMWNEIMALHAQAFYAAEVLGVAEPVNAAIFQAMNVDRKRLGSKEELAALFAAHGVAEEDFNKAFNSFGVGSQVRQANATAKAAKITGTPALIVQGKYHVSARKAGSQSDMLKVVDFLVEKERAAMSAAAGAASE